MSLVTCSVSISVDGFLAGQNQTLENPFGDGVDGRLHRWMVEQPDENAEEIAALTAAGAFVMGRNMFGAGRGEWDAAWRGWWGDDPPYHAPVYVLTHHPRDPIEMEGGTTFHFVTEGIGSALAKAGAAAGGKKVSIAGGADTINQYLAAGLIDELSLHIAPIILGAGERLFIGAAGVTLTPLSSRTNELVTHVNYRVSR